ncbi:MAG: D-alanyl-lipoteichoic acid biosynthesis protein DltB [Chloroflexi bacterium]|nr:D-alanyl-lipoteichoic acid biosynthesis protein DltB [Chloroflexota bacterium]
MTPYVDFTYFGLMLYPLIPTLILGWCGRRVQYWLLIVTSLVLVVLYSDATPVLPTFALPAIWLVVAYGIWQWLLAYNLLRLRQHTKRQWLFPGVLLLALTPLMISKFTPLFAPTTLWGFLGISYATFRSLDVLFGIQDGLIKTLPTAPYLTYLFCFPTLSAGPVDRYRRFIQDWQHTRTREEFLQDLDRAVERIFRGFLYKLILAVLIKRYWLAPIGSTTGLLPTLSYMYGYSFYLFFDFAGYSAFAIGFSYLFGIHTPENFNRPFLARNVKDFWNRWHISLSTWFRDHVYMRFLIAAAKGRWFKNKYTSAYLGAFLLFGLMGLWHGPELPYILYGLYHAIWFVSYEWYSRWNKQHKIGSDGIMWQAASILVTFHLICFGFLIFSGRLF